MTRKYNHYFRPIPPGVTAIDLYRFAEMFEITDSSLFHAVKKIVAAGKRGSKTVEQDVQEAIDSLQRWQEMRREETPAQKTTPERDKAPAECGVCAASNASDPLPVTYTVNHPQFGQLVISQPWRGWGPEPYGFQVPHPLPKDYPPDMGVKIRTAGGIEVSSTFGDCSWAWEGNDTDIVAFMPIPAASKPKTFMFKSVELRPSPGRTCEGCAVPGIGNCDHANDEARKAGAISSPGACGYQRLIYVRA